MAVSVPELGGLSELGCEDCEVGGRQEPDPREVGRFITTGPVSAREIRQRAQLACVARRNLYKVEGDANSGKALVAD